MQRRHRNAHARIWVILALALPAILIAAFAIRQVGPNEQPAVKIEPVAEASEK